MGKSTLLFFFGRTGRWTCIHLYSEMFNSFRHTFQYDLYKKSAGTVGRYYPHSIVGQMDNGIVRKANFADLYMMYPQRYSQRGSEESAELH